MAEKNARKMIPLFCEDGKAGKNASQRPQNSPQTAKAAGVDKRVVVLSTKVIPGAFKRVCGLLKVIRVEKIIVIIGNGVR
jgi:hypothetical protein